MTHGAAPLDLDAIAGFGEAVVRDARHVDAIAALGNSPVPALLESVHAVQAVLLSANPKALRAKVGWFGRLLGRDLVLDAEGRAFRDRLRVLVHEAGTKLAAFARFDDAIGVHEQRLLASMDELDGAIADLDAAAPDVQLEAVLDAIQRRRQHLLVLQQAWRITASQLAMTRLNHRQLAQRIQPMLPLVQVLLDQQHAARAASHDATALQSASRALDSANALLAGYSPTHPVPPEHAP